MEIPMRLGNAPGESGLDGRSGRVIAEKLYCVSDVPVAGESSTTAMEVSDVGTVVVSTQRSIAIAAAAAIAQALPIMIHRRGR